MGEILIGVPLFYLIFWVLPYRLFTGLWPWEEQDPNAPYPSPKRRR